jgi:hypothetical protein
VLGTGAGVAGVTALGAGEAWSVPASSAPLRADYAASVGRTFTARHGRRSIRVRLTDIRDLKPTTSRQRAHCFALIFEPVGSAPLHDAIYVISRRGVRTHTLFLSSLGTAGALQAIINRRA